jgi:hypothetical protein
MEKEEHQTYSVLETWSSGVTRRRGPNFGNPLYSSCFEVINWHSSNSKKNIDKRLTRHSPDELSEHASSTGFKDRVIHENVDQATARDSVEQDSSILMYLGTLGMRLF